MNIRDNLVDDLQFAMAPSTSQMQLKPVTRSPDTNLQSRERFLVNTAICAIPISRPQTSTFRHSSTGTVHEVHVVNNELLPAFSPLWWVFVELLCHVFWVVTRVMLGPQQ